MIAVTPRLRVPRGTVYGAELTEFEVVVESRVHHHSRTCRMLWLTSLCALTSGYLTPALPRSSRASRAEPPRLGPLRDEFSRFSKYREDAVLNSICERPTMFDSSDSSDSFDFERWATHRSSSRYGRELLGILFGATTRRVLPTVGLLLIFSCAVEYYNSYAALGDVSSVGFGLPPGAAGFLPELQLPIAPFELTSPVLGLLLVFRTDTANDRFNAGTDSAWEVTASMRSFMRRLVAMTSTDACAAPERDAARDLILAALLLHGEIMGPYLRGRTAAVQAGMGEQPQGELQSKILRLALGVGASGSGAALTGAGAELDAISGAELDAMAAAPPAEVTPSLALTAISIGVSQRLTSLSDQERIALDDQLATVTCALSKCEKILRTPIPLGYTRYSVRFLWIWLTLLPFALVRTFVDFGANTWWADKPQPVLAFAMLFIGFIFLSIEDIAVQIEEPFAILPLELHQKYLLRDARSMEKLMDWAKRRRAAKTVYEYE